MKNPAEKKEPFRISEIGKRLLLLSFISSVISVLITALVLFGMYASARAGDRQNGEEGFFKLLEELASSYFVWLYLVIGILLLTLIYALVLLFMTRGDIRYLLYLRDEMRLMSGGDLSREIRIFHKTEMGQIGEELNTLRKNVAGQIEKEYAALTANRELITAMSHDLRTPLTRQIGYLEILHLHKYENDSQRDVYIEKARNNAFVMKDTTDKLFRYFLAFGQKEQTEKMVEVDGRALLNSALREQTDYLKSQQFAVSFAQIDEPIRITIDPEEFARIFDNIFQNIKKYGDISVPVVITYAYEGSHLLMMIQNGIREDISKVESTRIGLKIVDRIMTAMGGSAEAYNDGRIFIMQLMFPVTSKEDEGI